MLAPDKDVVNVAVAPVTVVALIVVPVIEELLIFVMPPLVAFTVTALIVVPLKVDENIPVANAAVVPELNVKLPVPTNN